MNQLQLLKDTLEKNKQEYIEHLQNLVRCDTEVIGHGIDGGGEGNGQEYVSALFEKMGADEVIKDQLTEEVIQKALAEHQEGNPGHNYENRYNVYSTFKGGEGKSLMFNGHIDTMPAGDKSLWVSDPHAAEISADGKRITGVGVCDMKGGLMGSIMAVKLLQDAGIPLPCDVKYTSVIDEEGGGNGSIAAAMAGQRADAVIICEPSDRGFKQAASGFIFFKVEIEGIACHSGSKWLGVSAIEKAIKIIGALDELEKKWVLNFKHPLLPPPTGNVGVIEGGKAGSTVADYCCFKTCIHYLPEVQNYDSMVAEYTETINRCCDGDEWLKDHKPKISIYQAGGAFEEDPNSPFTKVVAESFTEVTGDIPPVTGLTGGCDSRTWKNIAKMPVVQYGPGQLDRCHSVNEYLEIDEYLESIMVYATTILNWGK